MTGIYCTRCEDESGTYYYDKADAACKPCDGEGLGRDWLIAGWTLTATCGVLFLAGLVWVLKPCLLRRHAGARAAAAKSGQPSNAVDVDLQIGEARVEDEDEENQAQLERELGLGFFDEGEYAEADAPAASAPRSDASPASAAPPSPPPSPPTADASPLASSRPAVSKAKRRRCVTVPPALVRFLLSLFGKARIAWSFYQIVSLIPSVYDANLPESISSVLESMSVVTGLSFDFGAPRVPPPPTLKAGVSRHSYV